MKTFYSLLASAFLLVSVGIADVYAQCSSNYFFTPPGSAASQQVTNGKTLGDFNYCPGTGTPTGNRIILTLDGQTGESLFEIRDATGIANPAGTGTGNNYTVTLGPVLQTVTLDNVATATYSNTATLTLPAASRGRTYQLVSRLTKCSNDKFDVSVFTANPVLSLTASQSGSTVNSTVCPGSAVTLTAAVVGETPPTGTIYVFYTIDGSGTETIIQTSTSTSVSVTPSTSTNYYVRTNTTTCGNNTTQTINVATNQITVASSAASAVCAGTPVTLSANNLVGGTNYTLRNAAGTTVATAMSSAGGVVSFSVTPTATTTYTVVGPIPSCSSGNAQGSITVSANALSLTSNDADNTIERGNQITLTAANGAAGSTYTWRATTANGTTTLSSTGSTITETPLLNTTYSVTGTTAAGNCTNTQDIAVTVTTTLPVELVNFKAAWTAAGPKLVWATASERNSATFEVERSVDAKSFVTVGKRTGAGTSSARIDYSFLDESMAKAPFAQLYYRLKQVDRDGTTTFSEALAVQVPTKGRQLHATAYPNPFGATLKVSLADAVDGAAAVRVYDILGKLVLTHTLTTQSGTSAYEVPNMNTLMPGIYYLSISQSGRQQMIKIRRQ